METKKLSRKTTKLIENDWEIFGVRLFSGEGNEVLKFVEKSLALEQKNKWIATVNPEFVIKSTKINEFFRLLNKTDLNVIDGIGLVWAKLVEERSGNGTFLKRLWCGFETGVEILRGKHKEKLASGSDLMDKICKLGNKKGYRIFFLGGWRDRAEKTAKRFKLLNTNLQCASSEGEPRVNNEEVIRKINRFKPDVLFVAYGMKKQEEWIDKNLEKLNVGIVMGVGRSFDYYSGDLKRAPIIWRKMGFEWLYSLLKEPKRWKRQLALPEFIWKVLTK